MKYEFSNGYIIIPDEVEGEASIQIIKQGREKPQVFEIYYKDIIGVLLNEANILAKGYLQILTKDQPVAAKNLLFAIQMPYVFTIDNRKYNSMAIEVKNSILEKTDA